MIPLIENNPFRILGVYSDSRLIDIIANANKIKAFIKVGRDVSFEIDRIHGFSTPPGRSIESVENALALILSDSDKLKNSIFWFNKKGIDFGTTELISGNVKDASIKFISAIETNDITTIQEVIGDKANSFSSSDLLRYYIKVMTENGYFDDAVSGCKSEAKLESHITIITSLKINGLSEDLKKKADSIAEISIDNSSLAFTLLVEKINEVKQLIVGYNISNELALSISYDQVCKSVRSKVISISNKAFDCIGKTKKSEFVTLLNSCLDILKSIDTSFASVGTSTKYKDTIETISNNIKDVDETFLLAIASNKEICWFCGKKANYSYKIKYEKEQGYFGNMVYKYTNSVKFHVCGKCMLYHELKPLFIVVGVILFFIAEVLLITCFYDDWRDAFLFSLAVQVFIGVITIYGGKVLGVYIQETLWSIFHIRKESDHPLVKQIKKEGFS